MHIALIHMDGDIGLKRAGPFRSIKGGSGVGLFVAQADADEHGRLEGERRIGAIWLGLGFQRGRVLCKELSRNRLVGHEFAHCC